MAAQFIPNVSKDTARVVEAVNQLPDAAPTLDVCKVVAPADVDRMRHELHLLRTGPQTAAQLPFQLSPSSKGRWNKRRRRADDWATAIEDTLQFVKDRRALPHLRAEKAADAAALQQLRTVCPPGATVEEEVKEERLILTRLWRRRGWSDRDTVRRYLGAPLRARCDPRLLMGGDVDLPYLLWKLQHTNQHVDWYNNDAIRRIWARNEHCDRAYVRSFHRLGTMDMMCPRQWLATVNNPLTGSEVPSVLQHRWLAMNPTCV